MQPHDMRLSRVIAELQLSQCSVRRVTRCLLVTAMSCLQWR